MAAEVIALTIVIYAWVKYTNVIHIKVRGYTKLDKIKEYLLNTVFILYGSFIVALFSAILVHSLFTY